MNYGSNSQNQIWPRDWMGNDAHPSEDNLILMDGKERWKYFNGKPRRLKKKIKLSQLSNTYRI